MKILITGGAGFIGSHVAEELLISGYEVLTVDNYETGRDDNLGDYPSLTKHHNEDIVSDIFKVDFEWFQPDIVVHAAASYKDPNNWERDARTNCVGTAIVCQLCKEFKVKKLIYFQTSLCYGVNPVSLNWEIDRPISIYQPLNPAPNSYAITKTTGERIIAMSDVPFISFRLANCYGPRNLSGPVPTFYKMLSENKQCTVADTRRDFIYIQDLVNLVIRAILGERPFSNYYHVSTGRDYAISKLYEIISKIMKKELPSPKQHTNSGDVRSILLDPSETLRDFPGWVADTPLEKGIKKAIDWYKKHKIMETYTHLGKE